MGRRKLKKAKRKSKKGRGDGEVEGVMSEKPPSPSPQRFLIRVKLLDPVKDPEPPKQTDDCRLLPYAAVCRVDGILGLARISRDKLEFSPDGQTQSTVQVDVKSMRSFHQSKEGTGSAKLRLHFERDASTHKLEVDMSTGLQPFEYSLKKRNLFRDAVQVAMDVAGVCTIRPSPIVHAPAAALARAPPATPAAPPATFNSMTLVHASKCTLGSDCTFPDCSFYKSCAARLKAHTKDSCKNGTTCKICKVRIILESKKAKECATPQPVPISRQLMDALCHKLNAPKRFRAICRLTGQSANGGVSSMAMRIQVEYEQQKLRNAVLTPMQSLIGQFLNDRPEFDRRVASEVDSYDKVQFEKDQARQQRHRQAQHEAQEREAAARQAIAVNAAAAAATAAAAAANAVAATVAATSFHTAPTLSAVSTTIPRCDFFARTQSVPIDYDIEASNATISVTDPVSLTPITTPVKATGCKHTNCFDLESHKTRFYGRPNADWKCGICNAHAPLYELRIDAWTEALLAAAGPDAKFVEYEAKTGAFVRALSEKANGKRKRSDDAIDVESIRAGSSTAPIEVDSD